MRSGLFSEGKKVSLAVFPVELVANESNIAPITPPTRGTALLKLPIPFSLSLLKRRKPTLIENIKSTEQKCNIIGKPGKDITIFGRFEYLHI